ncbi:DUF2535 family protein [Bacillus sp. 2205SS5-2]|uniref:DUF2535 family protein n=1 Tax=Bacillus sp. 2205SS5-2 TaxID=3109031 RepID=UPI0030079CE5
MKSYEFRALEGKKVKIVDIPVLNQENPLYFQVHARFQLFVSLIVKQGLRHNTYSFRTYLKKVLKWTDYEELYHTNTLQNNA